jgi:hypothetical protein
VLVILGVVFLLVHYSGSDLAVRYAGLLMPLGIIGLLGLSLWALGRKH